MSAFRSTTRLANFSRTFARNPVFRNFQRRRITTPAQDNVAAPPKSGFAKFWHSPVGPKTVHFWAPVMKWALVLAGVADFFRPAEMLSLSQNAALMATGAIWTRWCMIIKPRNVFLAAVNFFLGCVGFIQTTRILLWQRSQKGETVTGELKAAAVEEKDAAKAALSDPVGTLKRAEQGK
ncbi:uncharacterized protein K452DRAFT_239767 [Aplosporella prunicola CBS 121167]|uniref:Mitochondrial pyruvate carrier n=1 Tax=Aplosporella prunicola CBS 121167 TaxID=1176127 RepID=A0A6A6AUE6_9PEZI|nr:uncharacterized protein K452DRAFT_239767 [Aplosporella prunicola CBS 121167]KAF2135216.1 hypothetical protein K452DRAFT_239767 [Aplosporella prunicola CBS 121167]